MITCKPYKVEYMTDKTCVYNQCKVKELKAFPRKDHYGNDEIRMSTYPPEYYRIHAYDGCKIGQKLYEKAKKEGRLPSMRVAFEKIRKERRVHVEMAAYIALNERSRE